VDRIETVVTDDPSPRIAVVRPPVCAGSMFGWEIVVHLIACSECPRVQDC
jgi:hypothetical protein